jgi:hypothetical protein
MSIVKKDDIVIMMGAGDVWKLTPDILKKLEGKQ